LAPFIWSGNEQIKGLQTSHGVAMAVYNGKLVMAYVGEGGENLWLATFSNLNEPLTVSSNVQIKLPDGSTPGSNWRPALCVAGGLLHMVYQGAALGGIWWSWFNGTTWAGNVQLTNIIGGQPSLALAGNTLHLVTGWDASSTGDSSSAGLAHAIYQLGSPQTVASWSMKIPGPKSRGYHRPFLVSNGTALILYATGTGSATEISGPDGTSIIGAGQLVTQSNLPQDLWVPAVLAYGPTVSTYPVDSKGGAAVAVGTAINAVYVGSGGSNIWEFADQFGQYAQPQQQFSNIGLNEQVKSTKSTPETSAPMGIMYFQGNIVIAYKGASSDNFYVAYRRG
jgi:hypothetical protein